MTIREKLKQRNKSKQKKQYNQQKSKQRRETILDIIDIAVESLTSWWLWL